MRTRRLAARPTVAVFEENNESLGDRQYQRNDAERDTPPKHDMHPERRCCQAFKHPGHRYDQKAQKKNQQDGGAVAYVMFGKIGMALAAFVDDIHGVWPEKAAPPTRGTARLHHKEQIFDQTQLFPHQYTAAKRKSHTASTKCQYHAAASKPKWLLEVKCPLLARNRQTVRKILPTSTWKP